VVGEGGSKFTRGKNFENFGLLGKRTEHQLPNLEKEGRWKGISIQRGEELSKGEKYKNSSIIKKTRV